MRCPRHNLALAEGGTCIRCRQEDEAAAAALPRPRDPRRTWIVGGLLVALAACTTAVGYALRVGSAPVQPLRPAATVASIPSPSPAPPASLLPLAPAAAIADPPPAVAAPGAPTPLSRAAHQAAITLFCRPSADCAAARAWLLDRGYVYAERNIDVDAAAAATLRRAAPAAPVPAFDIDGQVVAGFEPARLERALDYAAARRLQR